jgi:Amt family ammonium transporter
MSSSTLPDFGQLYAVVAAQEERLAVQEERLAMMEETDWTSVIFLTSSTIFILFMQLGFALVESGSVRSKNTMSILLKNLLDSSFTCVIFYLIGYGIFTGHGNPVLNFNGSIPTTGDERMTFVFHWAFCSSAATVVSGSTASRLRFEMYVLTTILMAMIVYPIIAFWVWNADGLFGSGTFLVLDFAGAFPVHIAGGMAGLVSCIVVGPRTGSFLKQEDGSWKDERENGHSILVTTMGTMLLWIGWFGFNTGSVVSTHGSPDTVALVSINTALAASCGSIADILFKQFSGKNQNLWSTLNVILAALVSITPGCAFVEPWGAMCIGIGACGVYRAASRVLVKYGVDDVVDAFAVHGAAGIFGACATALLAQGALVNEVFGFEPSTPYHRWRQLGVQLLASVTVSAFVCIFFGTLLHVVNLKWSLRVTPDDELVGLDFKYMQGYAYPDFNTMVKKANTKMAIQRKIATKMQKINRDKSKSSTRNHKKYSRNASLISSFLKKNGSTMSSRNGSVNGSQERQTTTTNNYVGSGTGTTASSHLPNQIASNRSSCALYTEAKRPNHHKIDINGSIN